MSTKVKTDTTKNHRAVVTRHGGPDVLQMIEEELSEPQAGEVRVKVLAAGVSAYNLMFRSSGSLPGTPRVPFTLGTDVVGVVDKLGEGVTTVEPGQAVIFALVHFQQWPAGALKVGAIGLVFGFSILAVGRNLWPLIIAHGLIDTLDMVSHYLGGQLNQLT